MSDSDLVPVEQIQSRILVLRGVRVLLDADLAALYGVPTKRLNEQVKRNARRFPEDFVFRLTRAEKDEVVAKCDHLRNLRFAKSMPYAFTEFGAIQAANVVNTPAAEEMGIMVVRAFVQLRRMIVDQKTLTAKLAALDRRVGANEADIAAIVEAIRQLTTPDAPVHGRRIGFQPDSA